MTPYDDMGEQVFIPTFDYAEAKFESFSSANPQFKEVDYLNISQQWNPLRPSNGKTSKTGLRGKLIKKGRWVS